MSFNTPFSFGSPAPSTFGATTQPSAFGSNTFGGTTTGKRKIVTASRSRLPNDKNDPGFGTTGSAFGATTPQSTFPSTSSFGTTTGSTTGGFGFGQPTTGGTFGSTTPSTTSGFGFGKCQNITFIILFFRFFF